MANKFNLISLISVLFYVCFVNGFPKNKFDDLKRNKYYSREDWGATPATDRRPIATPVPYVVIHHTYLPAACNTTQRCFDAMKSMQDYHNTMNWGDIGYNFCVGNNGGMYEGRGWNAVGIHAGRANNHSYGICLIGDWRVATPPKEMLESTKRLISIGLQNGSISPNYKLIGHNQVMATECPGTALFNIMSTWDHFSTDVTVFKTIVQKDNGFS